MHIYIDHTGMTLAQKLEYDDINVSFQIINNLRKWILLFPSRQMTEYPWTSNL